MWEFVVEHWAALLLVWIILGIAIPNLLFARDPRPFP